MTQPDTSSAVADVPGRAPQEGAPQDAGTGQADVGLVPGNSLIVASPDEGRQLAIKLARSSVRATQPNAQVRTALRDEYAGSAPALIAIAQVVAAEFATIAAANQYWR